MMESSVDWTFWITLGIWMLWSALLCYIKCNTRPNRNPIEEEATDDSTKGYVYVVSNNRSFGKGIYKIGMTCRDNPLKRIDELNDASVPFPFEVHAIIKSNNAPALERRLHKLFHAYRVNQSNTKKEFFKVDIKLIQREVEKMGYPWRK